MTINYDTLGWILIVLGLLSGFVGLTMGLIQKDVKRLMAYCAISQTGYMLIGVGVGIATLHSTSDPGAFAEYGRTAMTGGIFHIMNHAFYKSLLFLTAGVMVLRFGTRNLNKMIGMAHRDTLTTIAFIVGSLAIVGVPPFNGFASKILIYESTYMFSPIVAILALFISILTLAIFIKVFYSAFLGPRRDDLIVNQDRLPVGMKLGMIILIALVVLFGLFPGVVLEYVVNPAVEGLINVL
jgi:multicomponent Na+:H+ antiporter subunit D